MLTVSRKVGEGIRIGEGIRVVVREVRGRQVRIGIEAPPSVPVYREEVYLRVQEENAAAVGSTADLQALPTLIPPAASDQVGAGEGRVPPGRKVAR